MNNLGVYESKNFVDITDDDWPRFFEINLLGRIRGAETYSYILTPNRVFARAEMGLLTLSDHTGRWIPNTASRGTPAGSSGS